MRCRFESPARGYKCLCRRFHHSIRLRRMGKFREFEDPRNAQSIFVNEDSAGRTLRRWRSAILKDEEEMVSPPPSPPPPMPANDPVENPWNPYLEPLLDLGTITINRTWMDLPQEIVDHVMFVLRHDLKSLKACSLTCKALFVSARPFIHRKICLTSELNWEMLTLREKQRYIRGEREGLAVKTLSGVAAHGLLRFGRRLSIRINQNFTPTNLQPFNDHFQRFDRIQELTIYSLHTKCFLEQFDTFFANFIPTLRSLHLDSPSGDDQDILNFICRFPHLDDLTIRMTSEQSAPPGTLGSVSPSIAKKIPPFRGRLKFDGSYGGHCSMLRQLISLPGKRRFRFVDFRGCSAEVEQPAINALSGTIETLSLTWRNYHREHRPKLCRIPVLKKT